MPEFKIKCWYWGERENKFFKDQGEQIYYKFSVVNAGDLPDNFFLSAWRDKFNERDCWLWISKELIKKTNISWENDKTYCFLMKLGEPKTAAFNIKDKSLNSDKVNNMVLKTKEYFENTVQKIGFWGSENYFYEAKKQQNPPRKPRQNNSNQPTNKNIGVKVVLICLPFLILALLLLLIKWMSKKGSKN